MALPKASKIGFVWMILSCQPARESNIQWNEMLIWAVYTRHISNSLKRNHCKSISAFRPECWVWLDRPPSICFCVSRACLRNHCGLTSTASPMIGVRWKIQHLCTAWWCIWSGYWVSWPAVLTSTGYLQGIKMKAFQAHRSSCGPLPFNDFIICTVSATAYGLWLTQTCMLLRGHNLLTKKQSPTDEASGFQPLLSRRCKFREFPSASQHFVVRQDQNKFWPKISGLVSSQRCASEMYDITSFADSVLPAPDSPLINTTYQWAMQATCAVLVCLSACVLCMSMSMACTHELQTIPELQKWSKQEMAWLVPPCCWRPCQTLQQANAADSAREFLRCMGTRFPNLWRNHGGALTACRPNA